MLFLRSESRSKCAPPLASYRSVRRATSTRGDDTSITPLFRPPPSRLPVVVDDDDDDDFPFESASAPAPLTAPRVVANRASRPHHRGFDAENFLRVAAAADNDDDDEDASRGRVATASTRMR